MTKLKAKFKVAKSNKLDIGKRASAARAEVARLRSLVKAEEAKVSKLEEGMQVAEMAISSIGNQAMRKAKQITSTTVEAGKWSTLVAKTQHDKRTTEQKWTTLKTQLDFLYFITTNFISCNFLFLSL